MLFAKAWTSPVRLGFPVVSDQSLRPAAAVGTAVAMPTMTRASAAGSEARPPARSKRAAMLHAPMGRSVRTGCSGCPMKVPLRRFRTGSGLTAFPTAFAREEATPSSRSNCSTALTTESSIIATPRSQHPVGLLRNRSLVPPRCPVAPWTKALHRATVRGKARPLPAAWPGGPARRSLPARLRSYGSRSSGGE